MKENQHWTVEPELISHMLDRQILEQQYQAAELYIKLHVLGGNPDAAAEASLAIHHWVGKDRQRQAAYEQARKVLYCMSSSEGRIARKRDSNVQSFQMSSSTSILETAKFGSLGWLDVLLLIFAALLLLPMIYFLAVPVGS